MLRCTFRHLAGTLAAALALLAVASSSAHAAQWIPPVTLPGVADSPLGAEVGVAPDGTVIAVWTRIETGKPQVVASVRPPGGSFSPPEPISAPNSRSPVIAVDGQGTATVVWMQLSAKTQLFKIQQSTRPAGGSFSVPQDLSDEADESEFPVIGANSAGATIVAWERVKVGPGNSPVIEAAARPAGQPFGPKQQLSQLSATAQMFEPQVAVGEDGTGMVAWSREGGDGEAARWTLAGGFAAPAAIAASDDFVESPDVAIDASGTAVFAYFGIEAGARGIRTQIRTAGGGASASSQIAPLPGTAGATPDLLADRAGDIVLTWDEHPVSPPGTSVIHAAVRPSGQGFGNPAPLSGALAATAPRAAAVSPAGDAVVAWIAPGERVQARIKPRGATAFGPLQDDFPVRGDLTNVAAFADPEGNAGVLWRRAGGGDPGTIEVRAFDGAPPQPLGLDAPSDAVAGRPATLSASFRDTWSPFAVNWDFGDGASAAGPAVQHAYGAARAFTATATALDAAGNSASTSRTVGVRALRPDEIDADADGFSAALDCDDANPGIRPGAPEVLGNAVDENCDNRREPFPKLTTNASISAFFGKKFSLMQGLRVTGLEGGETVRISCKGRGCRKSMRGSVRVRRKVAVLKLDKRVRGARLRKGSRLEVRISKPGFVTRVTRFTIRLGKIAKRTELCQPPGARRPGRC